MNTSGYAIPWPKALATEIEFLCINRFDIRLRRQHAMELIAASFQKNSASLIIDDRLVAEAPEIPDDVAWEYVDQRIRQMMPELHDTDVEKVKTVIDDVWEEEREPDVALVKRLARNIVRNCEYHERFGYVRSVLLTERDLDEAGEVARSPNFDDFMVEMLPFPSTAPFDTAKPRPEYENRYELEPGCIQNVMAYLRPDDWSEFLARYE